LVFWKSVQKEKTLVWTPSAIWPKERSSVRWSSRDFLALVAAGWFAVRHPDRDRVARQRKGPAKIVSSLSTEFIFFGEATGVRKKAFRASASSRSTPSPLGVPVARSNVSTVGA
jgi:hypothetical protein